MSAENILPPQLTEAEKKASLVSIFEEPDLFPKKREATNINVVQRGIERANFVNEFIEKYKIDVPATVLPAVKLHLFRLIINQENIKEDEVLKKAISFARHLGDLERKFMNPKNPLPTIGVELEMLNDIVDPELDKVFKILGIRTSPEDPGLYEVRPDFAFSAWVQGRILEDVKELCLRPAAKKDPYMVNQNFPLSLHINLGVPAQLSWDEIDMRVHIEGVQKDFPEVKVLSDLLVYAYSSPTRIIARKMNNSTSIKTDAAPNEKTGNARLEFRATEFSNYPTYRLLVESQRLASMFFSHLKKILEKKDISATELELASHWQDFENEVARLLYEEKHLEPNVIDTNKMLAFGVLKNDPELKTKCRALITKYSQLISGILKIDQVLENAILESK